MAEGPLEDFKSANAVPSLVYSCQRVLAANIDSIASFGDAIPHRLIRPILQGCNADTLLRLEKETPSIQERTSELWKDICVRFYPVAIEEMLKCANEEPESWRDEFFCLRNEEARRFEEAASRCRSQRIEIGELKRKRQVKLTDRLPPPKRSRSGWSSTGPMPPKSLLEKTRKEATKIQKSVFGSRSLPPTTGNSILSRTKFSASTAQMGQQAGRSVIINTATVRKPCTLASPSQASRKPQLPGKPPPDVVRGRTESSSAISRETVSTRNR